MCEFYAVNKIDEKFKTQFEQMGTKPKFWFIKDNEHWLFKYNRPNTGEDWSEKITSEIAELLGLPHAFVELAECEDKRGIITKDFTERKTKGVLVHGNEILSAIDSDYPARRFRKVSQHSIDKIIEVLSVGFIQLPSGYSFSSNIDNAIDLFLGYLLLDAFVGNTDRHHENWGVLARQEDFEESLHVELAPTFDHASSLGRELEETNRESLLAGNSYRRNVATYAQRASSPIYLKEGDDKPLLTFDAFIELCNQAPEAKEIWLDKLGNITDDSLKGCIGRIPKNLLSCTSGEFVYQMLLFNKQRLLNTK